jgi:hypothetical protein
MKYLFFLLLLISLTAIAQTKKIDNEMNTAFQNAKKGIYWVLSNIPEEKSRLNNDLIANDKLFCEVKLDKKINGVKIESTGYFESDQVTVIVYKSYDSLIKEGFVKKEMKEKN